MSDSLDSSEMQMALEENGLRAPDARHESLVRRIRCNPEELTWVPPDHRSPRPQRVLVVGRADDAVLFYCGIEEIFGVGKLDERRRIGQVRIFRSLSRALFEFQSHMQRVEP